MVGHTVSEQPEAHAVLIRDFENPEFHGLSWKTGYCPPVVFVVLDNCDFVLEFSPLLQNSASKF